MLMFFSQLLVSLCLFITAYKETEIPVSESHCDTYKTGQAERLKQKPKRGAV